MGPNTVTMTATDPSGNSSECEVTVTVVDGAMPWGRAVPDSGQ
ncbi:HYR domain-containing protein [Yoonia sp.]